MKKLLAFLLALCMIVGLLACTANTPASTTEPSASTDANDSSSTPTAAPADGDTVKIGVVCAISGLYAMEGQMVSEAIQLLEEDIAETGGLVRDDGSVLKVQFIIEDNEGDAETSVNCFNKLIDNDGVSAIVGPPMSGCLLAAGEISQAKGIPTIGTMTTNVACTQIGDYIFRACFIDAYQAKIAAKYMWESGYTEVGVLTNNADDYSNGLSNNFIEAFTGLGGKIVAQETFSDAAGGDVKDFSVQLTKLKMANPQAIFSPTYYMNVPDILKQANQLGLDVPFVGTDSWDTPEVLGMIDPSAKTNACYISAFTTENPDERCQNFIKRFNENFGGNPNSNAAYAYDAALAMCEAIRTAKTLAPSDIRDALAGLSDFSGVTGQLVFDADRNPVKDAYILAFDGNDVKYVTTLNLND